MAKSISQFAEQPQALEILQFLMLKNEIRFEETREFIGEKLSTSTLTNRLNDLMDMGVVEKTITKAFPRGTVYRLTVTGLHTIEGFQDWVASWGKQPNGEPLGRKTPPNIVR